MPPGSSPVRRSPLTAAPWPRVAGIAGPTVGVGPICPILRSYFGVSLRVNACAIPRPRFYCARPARRRVGRLFVPWEGFVTAVTPAPTVEELRAQLPGRVLEPADDGYDADRSGFGLTHTHTPKLIVSATSTDDVVAAVKWAAANGLSVAVMSTGHGSVRPYADCVLINTSRMNSFSIDAAARTATLGAGVRWRDVIPAAHELGLATINGSSSGVGVVGYTTGGGAPVMGRTFGFSADHVVEFELVTADGAVRRCTPETEPELFWAVRGGKGNFGIVTSLTVNLVPVKNVYAGGLIYDGPAAETVFRTYAEWVETLPDEMTTSLALMRLPDLPFVPPPLAGKLTVHLRVVYVGDPAEGARLLAPMRELGAPIIIH